MVTRELSTTPGPSLPLEIEYVDFELVTLSETNPRTSLDATKLEELKASIQKNGLLNPITVRERGGGYEIIAGERRFMAMKQLHEEDPKAYTQMPVIRRDVQDAQIPVLQLVENIQRADLTPVEIAEGIARTLEVEGVTEDAVADELGWTRRTVKKYLQLHAAPGWLRDFGLKVPIPCKSVDEKGNPVIDVKTNKQAVKYDDKPGLEFSFLIELIRFYNKLRKWDADRYNLDGSHKPLADSTTRRLAFRAAAEEWPRTRLESELERVFVDLTAPKGSAAQRAAPKRPYIVDKRRLVVERDTLKALTPGELGQFAAQAQEFFKALGFKNVLIAP